MKRTITTLLSLSLLLGAAPSVFAEDGSSEKPLPPRPGVTETLKRAVESKKEAFKSVQETFRASTTDIKKDMKEAVEKKKEGLREAREEFRGQIAKMMVNRTAAMLTAAVERFQKIIERTNTRIAELKAGGAVTADAELKIAAAQKDLTDARTEIQAITNIGLTLSTSTATTTVKTSLDAVRTDAQKAKDLLKSAQQNIQKALKTLRPLEKGRTATTSASVNS